MPQQPTEGAVPAEVVRQFKGLNDQTDSVLRPKGTVTSMQNMYDEQAGDANRRAGRDLVSLDPSGNPISLIIQLSWDDGGVSIINQTGSTFSYDAFRYSDDQNTVQQTIADPNDPGPMPNLPHFLPFINKANSVPDLSSLFNALQDANITASQTPIVWSNAVWSFDTYDVSSGTPVLTGINVNTKEAYLELKAKGVTLRATKSNPPRVPGNYMDEDFYWIDYVAQPGVWVRDLQAIITNANVVATFYIKNILTSPISFVTWAPGTFETTLVTLANFRPLWARMANKLNNSFKRLADTSSAITSSGISRHGNSFSIAPGGLVTAAVANCLASKFPSIPNGPQLSYDSDAACTLSGISTPPAGFGALGTSQNNSSAPLAIADLYSESFSVSIPGDGEYFIQFGPTTARGSDPFTYYAPTYYGSPPVNTWVSIGIQTAGIPYTAPMSSVTNDYAAIIAQLVTAIVIAEFCVGWEVLDSVAAIDIDPFTHLARGPTGQTQAISLITPDEYFSLQGDQTGITTSPVDVSWDIVKLTSSGGASRAYTTTDGSPVNITPTTTLDYRSDTPGFSAERFGTNSYYRPVILLVFSPDTTATAGSPTELTVKFYVNGTLVRTTTSVPLTGGSIYYGFSIEGVGNFTDKRPPDNDPNDNLDGWPLPTIRFTVQTDTGTVKLNAGTSVLDYVLQYPV